MSRSTYNYKKNNYPFKCFYQNIYNLPPTSRSFIGLNGSSFSKALKNSEHPGQVTDNATMVTMLWKVLHLHTCKFMLQYAINSRRYACWLSPPDFWFLCIAPLILRFKTINGHLYIPHTDLFLTTLIIFDLTKSKDSGQVLIIIIIIIIFVLLCSSVNIYMLMKLKGTIGHYSVT